MVRIVTIVVMSLIMSACNSVPPYDGEAHEQFAQKAKEFQHFTHEINNQPLHGVRTGHGKNPAIIFIHGAPGDWKAWGEYLGDEELRKHAFMIAIDRPGYAGSSTGLATLSLQAQAAAIIGAARKEHTGPFFLVGHSYGGPVQLQIAQDFPELVTGMLVLAGAIDPVAQKSRWYHHLAATWLGRQVLPQALNITTEEMLSLPNELKLQQPWLSAITAKTTVIQGDDDWLVPANNADYAKTQLHNAEVNIIALPGQGHFIPWERFDLVKRQLLLIGQ